MKSNEAELRLARELRGMTNAELSDWQLKPKGFDPNVNAARVCLAELRRRSKRRCRYCGEPRPSGHLITCGQSKCQAAAYKDGSGSVQPVHVTVKVDPWQSLVLTTMSIRELEQESVNPENTESEQLMMKAELRKRGAK